MMRMALNSVEAVGKPIIRKKIAVLGSPGVGKTSLVRRFVYGSFDSIYLHTIGVWVAKKQIELPQKVVRLVIWDIVNDVSTDAIASPYLMGASAAVVVSDISRIKTIASGINLAKQLHHTNPNLPIFKVFNKIDEIDPTPMVPLEQRFFAGNPFYASAKLGIQVDDIFRRCAADVADPRFQRILVT